MCVVSEIRAIISAIDRAHEARELLLAFHSATQTKSGAVGDFVQWNRRRAGSVPSQCRRTMTISGIEIHWLGHWPTREKTSSQPSFCIGAHYIHLCIDGMEPRICTSFTISHTSLLTYKQIRRNTAVFAPDYQCFACAPHGGLYVHVRIPPVWMKSKGVNTVQRISTHRYNWTKRMVWQCFKWVFPKCIVARYIY